MHVPLFLALQQQSEVVKFFTHSNLCITTVTNNTKWLKITQIGSTQFH